MSLHPSSSALPLCSPARSIVDARFFTAAALLLAVQIADALVILTAAPSLAELGSLYVSTI